MAPFCRDQMVGAPTASRAGRMPRAIRSSVQWANIEMRRKQLLRLTASRRRARLASRSVRLQETPADQPAVGARLWVKRPKGNGKRRFYSSANACRTIADSQGSRGTDSRQSASFSRQWLPVGAERCLTRPEQVTMAATRRGSSHGPLLLSHIRNDRVQTRIFPTNALPQLSEKWT